MATAQGGSMNESELIRHIKAHIKAGDKAKGKAEDHYIAAGQYLKQLKDDCPDQKAFLEKVEKEIGIGKSRTYELLKIGDGRKTVEETRADTAKRVAKHEQSRPLANGQNSDEPEVEDEEPDPHPDLSAYSMPAGRNSTEGLVNVSKKDGLGTFVIPEVAAVLQTIERMSEDDRES